MSLRSGLFALLLVLPLAAVQVARAAEVQVLSAWVNVRDDVFEVNARTKFPVDDRTRKALASGVTLNFDLQVVVEKLRRHWWDSTQADVMLRRTLVWNGVTLRYEVRDPSTEELRSFTTLDDALGAVGDVVNWPVNLEEKYDADARYRVRVRAGYRRGNLPSSLRALMPWSDSWNRSSEWNEWILPR